MGNTRGGSNGWRAVGLAAAVLCAAATGACRTGGPLGEDAKSSFASADEGLAALAGEWTLVELEGRRLADWLPPNWDDQPPSMVIEPDGSVGGYTGVNRMASKLDGAALVRGEFVLAPMISTRRAGPPELMHLEARYTGALQRARGVRLLGDALAVTPGPDRDESLARFTRTGRDNR